MDKEEAKRILQTQAGGNFESPDVAKAFALMETDGELRRWWQARQAFDQRVAAKLAEVPIPPHLHETILTENKIKSFSQIQTFPYWLAAAAALIFLAVVGWHPWINGSHVVATAIPRQDYDASLLRSVDQDPVLAMKSSDQQQLLEWLKTQGSPTGAIPTPLSAISSVGCKTMNMQGHAVSLICFALPRGGLVHLFIVDQKALAPPPPLAHPEFAQNGSWSMASWSDGNKSYVLASRTDMSTLQHLL